MCYTDVHSACTEEHRLPPIEPKAHSSRQRVTFNRLTCICWAPLNRLPGRYVSPSIILPGGGPEFGASDRKGNIFVNLEDKSALVKFDAKTLKIENTWPLAPCESPSGLAIDAEHEILIVGCHNKLMAFVDGNSGKVLGTVPIGQGVDANRFDPATGYAFASCGDGTLTIAHEDSPTSFSAVETIQTQRGARTMAIDYATHGVYLVTADLGPAPAATKDNPRPRPAIVPDTFTLLIYKK